MGKHVLSLCLLLFVAAEASAEKFVKLRYSIRNQEGKVIDSTAEGQAAVMALARMLPDWRAGVETMTAGERKTIEVPEKGYTIDTELVEIIDGPETPADLNAPPADAMTSRSGLASKVLREGSGDKSPKRRSTVRVNYSGWTTDGRLFDSTILRGTPAEFRLDTVIKGWTEGMMLMREGEVRRFWIPAKLAYEDDASKPQGMLVFDIELIEVK